MVLQKGLFVGLAVIATASLWLLLAGPSKVLGIDAGNAGIALLIAVAWASLHAVERMPTGGIEKQMSPGEWKAWTGLGFTIAVAAYAIGQAHVFNGPSMWHNPDANRVGRNITLLVVAWAILAQAMQARWKDGVQRDERDREIEARASGWARMVLSAWAIGLALLLGFSPGERLAWAPPPMIAHLLIIGLIVSCLAEYAVTAASYWRDRR